MKRRILASHAILGGVFALALGAPVHAQFSQFTGEVASRGAAPERFVEFEIYPDDLAAGDALGSSSAVQGDVAVIGAHHADDVATDGGAAYVYRRVGKTWQLDVKLAPTDLGQDDNFGYSCSLDGDVLAVSAPQHGALGTQVGTVYVYRNIGGSWTFEQKLFPLTAHPFGRFGTDVAVSGDVIAVGRYREVSGNLGEVHIFRYNLASWVEEDAVTAADAEVGDLYAYALDIDGDHLVVGSYLDDAVGSMYFYRFDGAAWVFTQKAFASDPQAGDLFSKGISMNGGVLVTGANREDQNGSDAGAAYVMRFNGVDWVHEQKLLASEGRAMDRFGTHVGIYGDLIVVGSRLDDHPGGLDAGSAYVFRRVGGTWVQSVRLVAGDATSGDWFGHTVATDGETVLVHALRHGHGSIIDSGASYAYSFPFYSGP